jgi:hypothetical protein
MRCPVPFVEFHIVSCYPKVPTMVRDNPLDFMVAALHLDTYIVAHINNMS